MKRIIIFIGAVACAIAQPINVQKTSGTNAVTGSLDFGSGKVLSFSGGASSLTMPSGVSYPTPTFTGTATWQSDVRQTFSPGATNSGLNVGSFAGSPSSLSNGDIWYDSIAAIMKIRAGGSTINLGSTGTIGGSTGSTDNALIRADGTGGSTIQAGGVVTLSDTGAFTFPAGIKQTFAPNGTTSGFNVGSTATDPSVPANGDMWYDSTNNTLDARINGATVNLGSGGGTPGGSTTQVQYNNAGAFGGISELTYASNVVTDTRLLAANTSGTGIELTNTSTASSGNQMYSPGIVYTGQGWKTNATAASQAVNFRQELRPAQGAANPVANMYFTSQINGGGYTSNERFLISSDGYIGAINGSGTATEIRFYEASTQRSAVGYSPANSRAYWYNNGTSAEAIQVKNAGEVALIATGTNQNISLTPSGTGRVIAGSGFNFRTPGGQMEFYNSANSTELMSVGGGSTYAYFYTGNGANLDAIRLYYSSPFMAIYPTAVHNVVIGAATDAGTGVIQLPSSTSASGGLAMGDVNLYRSASNVLKTDDALNVVGDVQFAKTITAAGTTGNQTINKTMGSVNFAATATSLVVTNSLVTTSSVIICTVATNDSTMKDVQAVAASGSFTLYANAAATAETRVNFLVIN